MPKSIKTHIFLLILFILFAQLILTLFLNFVQKEEMKGDMSQHIANTQMRQARRLCKSAWLMCSLDYKHIQQKLQENLSRTKRSLTKFGMLSPGETISFNAVDTSGANPLKLELPELFFGQNPVNMNSDPNTPSKVVDNLNVDDDIDVTIWQRINPEGDMLRLSANWKTADGKRAVGTYEKISNPKWKPIIQDILKGREHYCTVLAVDKKFAALFAPLTIERKGEGRTVVGMVGLGFSMNDVIQEITTSLASLQLGNNGFIGIIKGGSKNCGSPESTQGELILGSNKNDQGTNLWNRKTGETHPVRDIVNAGLSTSSGKTEIVKYLWPEPDKPNGVQKTAAVTYFAPFDWVLLAGINNDEFNSMSSQVDNNLDQMLYSGLIGDFILMALAALVAALLLHRIIQPINRVVTAAEVIAKGNLIEAGKLLPAQNNKQSAANGIIEKSLASSETNALWQAMEKMTGSLGSLVSRVQSSTSQLVESAGNIRNNASSQKETMADFEAHVSHIAAAISEISATSQELSRTMSDLKENSSQAAELASTGQEGLQGMEQMLNRLSEETASISSRLSLINEKANNIDSMVVTITKVAEQTNLLSLNAAIEAEKAGEYGLGFSVVAREIRRLADQTALATLDIEQMVEQMRSSVSQGVMEMERFTQDVRKSVNEGGHIGKKLSIVIDKVQELNPRFEKVSEGMQMQSQGAQQISQSMSQLTDAAKNLSQTFESFNTSSDKLRDEADELRNEISRFRVE